MRSRIRQVAAHPAALSYLSSLVNSALVVLALPLQYAILGSEAFGIVGTYATLQTVLGLLDVGGTSTLTREVARWRAGASTDGQFSVFFRTIELSFVSVGVLAVALVALAAPTAAGHWADTSLLAEESIRRALVLMGTVASIRWLTGIYKSFLLGMEEWGLVARTTIGSSIARNLVVTGIIAMSASSLEIFFASQFVVAIAELSLLVMLVRRRTPRSEPLTRESLRSLRDPARLAWASAASNGARVLFSQADRLMLTALLPLRELGILALLHALASLVTTAALPLSQVYKPALARLSATSNDATIEKYYVALSATIAAVAGTIAATLAALPSEAMTVYTGSGGSGTRLAADVLGLYAAGYFFYAITSPAYYLQTANGSVAQLRDSNFSSVMIAALAVASAALFAGIRGAAITWAIANMALCLIWTQRTHETVSSGLHTNWLKRVAAPSATLLCIAVLIGLITSGNLSAVDDRLHSLGALAVVGASFAIVNTMIASRREGFG